MNTKLLKDADMDIAVLSQDCISSENLLKNDIKKIISKLEVLTEEEYSLIKSVVKQYKKVGFNDYNLCEK